MENADVINGHEFVDLGLPSGLKWAACNLGALLASDYGNYFAWGETSLKEEYTQESSKTLDQAIDDISGNAAFDAARSLWGSPWRLPTKVETQELIDKCDWLWTTLYGRSGWRVTGPNGRSIFLPAAGSLNGSRLYNADGGGVYWSSTPREDDTWEAYALLFGGVRCSVSVVGRDSGVSIRPVSD